MLNRLLHLLIKYSLQARSSFKNVSKYAFTQTYRHQTMFINIKTQAGCCINYKSLWFFCFPFGIFFFLSKSNLNTVEEIMGSESRADLASLGRRIFLSWKIQDTKKSVPCLPPRSSYTTGLIRPNNTISPPLRAKDSSVESYLPNLTKCS